MPESNGRMDRIEAALDRLTERHGALAESVELLTADIAALGARVDGIAIQVSQLTLQTGEIAATFASHGLATDRRIGLLTEHMLTLSKIVREGRSK